MAAAITSALVAPGPPNASAGRRTARAKSLAARGRTRPATAIGRTRELRRIFEPGCVRVASFGVIARGTQPAEAIYTTGDRRAPAGARDDGGGVNAADINPLQELPRPPA